MPTFSNRPIGRPQSRSARLLARLTPQVRKHPVMLFGLPFVVMIVASSFGLSYMTQTRYDYNSSKVKSMSMEEELGMRKDRRKIDIREEYFVCTLIPQASVVTDLRFFHYRDCRPKTRSWRIGSRRGYLGLKAWKSHLHLGQELYGWKVTLYLTRKRTHSLLLDRKVVAK